MSYLFGDSTPSKLEGNYIEFLRDAVEFCVQVMAADERIAQGRAQGRSLEHATAGEYERLQKLGALVSKSFEGATLGAGDSATARCAQAILKSASELVRAEAVAMRSALEAELAKREAQSGQERDGCVKALETLVVKHDLPDMSFDVHLAISGAHYAGRSRLKTSFGLDAVMDLEVPGGHLFDRVIRVDRLMERLDVQAPEIGGWLHKEMKKRTQHLEKHHVAEFSMGSSSGLIKLRLQPDGTGPGFDVLFAKEAPRVRLARAEQQDGTSEPPFEVDDEDAKKLLALQGKLAAAALELTKHRRRLVEARIDGEAMRSHAKQTVLAERLIAHMAPVVQEIAWRSHSPGELVLRRLLSGDRREEIFLSKSELKQKIEGLSEANRALFDPLWASAAPTAAPTPIPTPTATTKGALGDSQPTIVNTHQHAQTIRYRPPTPARGSAPLGASTPPSGVPKAAGDQGPKPSLDAASKPSLDAPAGDVVRRTLIGATVESAVQNAMAVGPTPPPPASAAAHAAAAAAPPTEPVKTESVSKTPLANPSHVENLRKEAAGTIDAKQVGVVAKA